MNWNRIAGVLAAGAACPLAHAAEPVPSGPAPRISDPEWVARPTGDQLAAAYPPLALAAGIEGRVVLECTLNKNGFTLGCRVTEETPKGVGFDSAALRLATTFRMKPKLVNGQPVDDEVSIPLTFRLPGESPGDRSRLVQPVEWATRPTEQQFEAARPAQLKIGAWTVLFCDFVREGDQTGALRDCRVMTESPRGAGVGQAGLDLAPRFRLSPTAARAAPPVSGVELPLRWKAPPPAP